MVEEVYKLWYKVGKVGISGCGPRGGDGMFTARHPLVSLKAEDVAGRRQSIGNEGERP